MKKYIAILFTLFAVTAYSQNVINEGADWVEFDFEDGGKCRAFDCFEHTCFGDRCRIVDHRGNKYMIMPQAWINPATGVAFADSDELDEFLLNQYARICQSAAPIEPPSDIKDCADVLDCLPADIDTVITSVAIVNDVLTIETSAGETFTAPIVHPADTTITAFTIVGDLVTLTRSDGTTFTQTIVHPTYVDVDTVITGFTIVGDQATITTSAGESFAATLPTSDGSETIVTSTGDITISGSGTTADPYIIGYTHVPSDGSETIVNGGVNTLVTGTGTTADPYIVNATDTNTELDTFGIIVQDSIYRLQDGLGNIISETPIRVGSPETLTLDTTYAFNQLDQGNFGFIHEYTGEDGVLHQDTVEWNYCDIVDSLNCLAPLAITNHQVTGINTSVDLDAIGDDIAIDSEIANIYLIGTTGVNGGTYVNNNDGTVTYTPPTDFVGIDSIAYYVDDQESDESNIAYLIVEIDPETPIATHSWGDIATNGNITMTSHSFTKLPSNTAIGCGVPGRLEVYRDHDGDGFDETLWETIIWTDACNVNTYGTDRTDNLSIIDNYVSGTIQADNYTFDVYDWNADINAALGLDCQCCVEGTANWVFLGFEDSSILTLIDSTYGGTDSVIWEYEYESFHNEGFYSRWKIFYDRNSNGDNSSTGGMLQDNVNGITWAYPEVSFFLQEFEIPDSPNCEQWCYDVSISGVATTGSPPLAPISRTYIENINSRPSECRGLVPNGLNNMREFSYNLFHTNGAQTGSLILWSIKDGDLAFSHLGDAGDSVQFNVQARRKDGSCGDGFSSEIFIGGQGHPVCTEESMNQNNGAKVLSECSN